MQRQRERQPTRGKQHGKKKSCPCLASVHSVFVWGLILPFVCFQVWLHLYHGDSIAASTRKTPTWIPTTRQHGPVNKAKAPQTHTNDTKPRAPAHNPPLTTKALSSSTTMTTTSEFDQLPAWIRDYVKWHRRMRTQFPGRRLLDDPAAPPLLIRTCFGLCVGLNDRLGQLPWDLYMANQTGRLLLLHWHRPVPLENFLVPPHHDHDDDIRLDWRVPQELSGFFPSSPQQRIVGRQALRKVRQSIPDLFDGYPSDRPTDDFWKDDFSLALARATTGNFSHHKILRHRLLGHLHEHVLEERLRSLGETDLIHGTPTFGRIFRFLFRLAPPLQAALDHVYQTLHLQPGSYSAVHCRVRHPKAVIGLVKGKNDQYPADKTGLPWEGETRQMAITTAVRAIRCTQTLPAPMNSHRETNLVEPIYFLSDSNDLVRYMSQELYNTTYVQANLTSAVEHQAHKVAQAAQIVARPSEEENAHIDRQKGRPAQAYYGTFIDLYLAMQARCVTYGVGFYAVFATKLSHTSCKLLYQQEAWGGDVDKTRGASLCHLPDDDIAAALG